MKSALQSSLGFLLHCCLRIGGPRKKKKCAIYKPDGIGDFVLSSEALRVCIEAHGQNSVALIVACELAELAKQIFPDVEILPIVPSHLSWDTKLKGLPALRAAIQANAYDQVFCFRHYRTFYDDIILRAIDATRVVLLPNQSSAANPPRADTAPTNAIYVQPDSEVLPENGDGVPREWMFHAAVLSESLGRFIPPESLRPNWDIHRTTQAPSRPFVLISPTAGRKIRDLPLGLVQAAARQAIRSGLGRLVLTGTRQQSAQLNIYAESLRVSLSGSTVEIAQPADLPALVTLVASATLVITAETSTAHIAAALDQPTLVLIGGGHYGWFGPWRRSPRQVWLTHRMPCFDCNWRCPYREPFCLTHISADEIQAELPIPRIV